METVTILRELWRRRVLVGLAALAAILVGLMLTYKFSLPPESRTFKVGIATSRILVDTPDSQVVDVAPRGSETVGARANLLANLMTQGEVKAAIAQRAGLRPTQLVSSAESAAELPLAESTQGDDSQAHLMMTRLVINAGGDPLPIIEVDAQAPDAGSAARLATAAVTGLRAYLDSKAATEEVSDARRLRVSGLGAPQVREDIRGPRNLTALGAAAFVFLSGCVGILIVSALARGWRVATEQGKASAVDHDRTTSGDPVDHQRSGRLAERRLPEVVGEPRELEGAGVGAVRRGENGAESTQPPASRKKRSRAKRRKHRRNS